MDGAADLDARVALVGALGRLRGAGELDALVGIALDAPSAAIRRAAAAALDDRLVDGIEVELSGSDAPGDTPAIDWGFLGRLGASPRLELQTERGLVVLELDSDSAPQTVQTLAATARAGRYDGVAFHRVVPNFVAQGGDVFRGDGWGGPPVPIRSELTRRRFRTGVAGIASSGKDTEGTQFFVMHSPAPHLDGRYTAFGRVVVGAEVVDRLVVGDRILTARIVPTAMQ